MKRVLIIGLITLSLTFGYTAFNMQIPNQTFEVANESIDQNDDSSQGSTNESSESEEVGLVYINTEMDFFSFIEDPGWYYENYNGMVVFYNNYSTNAYNSIAVSSFEYPVPKEDRVSQTELFIGQAVTNLEQIAKSIEVTRTEDFTFGENNAYRYYYSGILISEDVNIEGEYLYWWIGDKIYTCSLFCTSDQYENFSTIMHDMLNNFQQPSTMN